MFIRPICYYRNGFYGDVWASLMQRELDEWLQVSVEHQNKPEPPTEVGSEGVLTIAPPCNVVDNLYNQIHGLDETLSPEKQNVNEDIKLPLAEKDSPLLNWSSLDQLKKRLVYDICPKVATAVVHSIW